MPDRGGVQLASPGGARVTMGEVDGRCEHFCWERSAKSRQAPSLLCVNWMTTGRTTPFWSRLAAVEAEAESGAPIRAEDTHRQRMRYFAGILVHGVTSLVIRVGLIKRSQR
jgi:hypothetical protein